MPNDDRRDTERIQHSEYWASLLETMLSTQPRHKMEFFFSTGCGRLNYSKSGASVARQLREALAGFSFFDLVEEDRTSQDPQAKFELLRDEWLASIGPTSDLEEIAMIWPYQRIIGMGYPAVPLILQELRERPHHWFWALRAITGENPVPPTARGKIEEMAKYWLQWGAENGFITDEPARTTTL
jgi:hypothetical protein